MLVVVAVAVGCYCMANHYANKGYESYLSFVKNKLIEYHFNRDYNSYMEFAGQLLK